ncbi:MAG: caspase family protein, partial [Bradyrhizobium sp.]
FTGVVLTPSDLVNATVTDWNQQAAGSGSTAITDQLAASLPVSTTATSTSPVGTYSLIPGGVQFLQGSESNYNITYQNGSLSIVDAQPLSDISAYTSAVFSATTTATSAISSGAVAGSSGGTGSSTSSVVTIAPTSSSARAGMPGGGAAAAAVASAQLVSNMLEERKRKLNVLAKSVTLLEQDPDIADLEFCIGPVSDDCIAVRPAGSGSRDSQQRVAEHSYLPGVERKVALLIGIDDYRGGIPKLSSPAKDVQEVGRIMRDKFGYEVRAVLNADKARIVHELNRLILESNDDDSIAIMYAGHGQLVEKTQRGYWIPAKASPDDPKQWLSNHDIARALGNISAKQIFLVSDSCYSGTLTREARIERADILPDPQAVLDRRSVTALSSGGDEPVADEGKDGHSVFAWHLIEQLKAVKDVSLGVGVYEQIAERVKAEIPQTPQYGASPSSGHQRGGDYLFQVRQSRSR